VAGVAETIRVGPTLGNLRELLAEDGQERVLVVDAGGVGLERAIFGDRMAARAKENGWQGVVINGLIRDVANLAKLDLGVWALGTCPRAAGEEPCDGERSVPLLMGGAQVVPGWWVVCDADGFVSCPTGPNA
jgi:regulator of ribonuclease activity A